MFDALRNVVIILFYESKKTLEIFSQLLMLSEQSLMLSGQLWMLFGAIVDAFWAIVAALCACFFLSFCLICSCYKNISIF